MSVHDVQVRPMRRADIREAAHLHLTAFPGFFLSELGEPFLREFYRAFLDAGSVALVARDADGRMLGVVVGHTHPDGFFRRLLVRRWLAFALASLGLVIRRPRVIPRLVRAVTYRGNAPVDVEGALLSSICVAPEARGTGLGRDLISRWTKGIQDSGEHAAFLTTDAVANDSVNRFYESAGWTRAATYRTAEGRQMNCYAWRAAPHA